MRILLASNNAKKLAEMNAILSELNICVESQKNAGFHSEPDETGNTFAENALIKAKALVEISGEICLADDSGLCVDALNGAPGVYSARYGGPDCSDEDRYRLILKELQNTDVRTARFVSSIACVFPNGDTITADGICEGMISEAPFGNSGFGYDPIFVPNGFMKTMAEMTQEEKNGISHRGKALQLFKTRLSAYLEETEK